jgi:hypothetical protein
MLGLPGDHDEAKRELRQSYGWGTRKGYWHCRRCKDDPDRVFSRLSERPDR